MTGDLTTWLLTFVAGAALVLLLAVSLNRLFGSFRTLKEEFHCPWVDRSVKVTYLTLDGRRPIGVLSCSAFADTTGVLCGMPCLAADGRPRGTPAQEDHVLDLLND